MKVKVRVLDITEDHQYHSDLYLLRIIMGPRYISVNTLCPLLDECHTVQKKKVTF